MDEIFESCWQALLQRQPIPGDCRPLRLLLTLNIFGDAFAVRSRNAKTVLGQIASPTEANKANTMSESLHAGAKVGASDMPVDGIGLTV